MPPFAEVHTNQLREGADDTWLNEWSSVKEFPNSHEQGGSMIALGEQSYYRRTSSAALSMLLVLLLSACSSVLPSEGPQATAILNPSKEEADHYAIIPVSAEVLRVHLAREQLGLRRVFGYGKAKSLHNHIGAGDVLEIHIWEATENGLFSTAENKRAQMPPVTVDKYGNITIPFVNRIKAAGLTPMQLQRRIMAALEGKAIAPQVLVRVIKNVANSVVVNGDVRKPGRYELSLKGDHVLDMVANAGGAAAPARETMVTLIRRGRRGVQSLKRIIDNPAENIFVQPGDQIYLSHKPQTFTAFGAVTKTGEYSFDSDRVNILEAVARTGGLLDSRADAKGVFLFRFEDGAIVSKLGYEITDLKKVPTVYVFDLSKPESFFLCQEFLMKDNDVIYVANSVSTELQKFLRLLASGTNAIRGTYGAYTAVAD